MPPFTAFLRAINVGGRVVKMEVLRKQFEALGFDNVSTFIASGNVIFETAQANADALESRIEERLQKALGYRVATFLRSGPEVAKLSSLCAKYAAEIEAGAVLYVIFARSAPRPDEKRRLLALNNEIDQLAVHGRDILWLCRRHLGESTLEGAALEKTCALEATVRNANTVARIAEKYF
jgi:uncharacterized protein (DUF1697 family)